MRPEGKEEDMAEKKNKITRAEVKTAADLARYCSEWNSGPDSPTVQRLTWQLIVAGKKIPDQMLSMICAAISVKGYRK